MQFSPKNECPKCGQSVLYFSADGLARVCENCDYQEAVPRKRRYPQELLRQIETKRSGAYRSSGIVNSENKGTGWVSGKYLTFHDDVLVPAAKHLSQSISKGFSEFDLDSLVAYDARYLASWPAERYQVALSEASLSAQRMVRDNMYRDGQRRLLHHEPIYNLTLNINGLHIESFKHILLPTWVTHYKANGQVYDVVVNGQTGLVHGERSPGIIDKLLSKLFK